MRNYCIFGYIYSSMTTAIYILTNLLLIFLTLSLFIFSVVFYKENENRAALISLLSTVLLGFLSSFIFLFNNEMLNIILLLVFIIGFLILIFPLKNKIKTKTGIAVKQFDERDIMFSRMELKEGSSRFEEYYNKHPEKKKLDDKFRRKAGLLSKDASQYHPFKFASADANFKAVESFITSLNEDKLHSKQDIDAKELSIYLKKWVTQIGAISVGITTLKDHHLYSIKGRGSDYGKKIINDHSYAIAFTVEMNKDMLDEAPKAEAIMESSQQYLEAAKIASQLTYFIRNLGYSAKPHFDGNYDLICPVVAKDAGLGEFGRMGLLMTPELGPRVRIAVVTTNIPLIIDEYQYEPSITDFCTICKKCADNCPAGAISFENLKDHDGVMRWKINHESCFTYWSVTGTDCGICIQVCPFSHPNNLMHNIIRKGIKNSYAFGEIALKMDDIFYGRLR